MKRPQIHSIAGFLFAAGLAWFVAVATRANAVSDVISVEGPAAPGVFEARAATDEQAPETATTANARESEPVQNGDQPKQAGGDETPEQAAADAKAQEEFLKAQADLIDAIFAGKPLDAVTALIDGAGSQLGRLLRPGLKAALRPILPMKISPRDRDASMQAPTVTVVNPGNFAGDLVYFVNGIDVNRELALDQAEALAARVKRPVGLIYNVTHGLAADLTESTYDRTWPLVTPVLHRLIQADSTTRQVAHLIFHATKRIAIVSHSQGCIIVRNALLMANTYTGGKAKDRVIWVATALPLRDEEICPKPARFRGITNRDDTVCQLIGLRLEPDKIDWANACAPHDFVKGYLDEIQPEDVR